MTTTRTLKKDVIELNGNLEKLAGTFPPIPGKKLIFLNQSVLGILLGRVNKIKTALKLPRQLNKQLGNIDNALNALSKVLDALSFVKQIKKIANRMNKQIKELRSKINKAETKLDKIVDAFKPYVTIVENQKAQD